MMPLKFGGDVSNGSGVIVFIDRQASGQTNTQTGTTENNTTLVVRMVNMVLRIHQI